MSFTSHLPLAALASAVMVAGLAGPATAQPAPVPPALEQSAGLTKIEGQVREIFGDKVVVEGPAGRVLVETGPEGRLRAPLAVGDTVSIDGVQRDGFVHAAGISKAGGARIALGPVPGEAGPGRMGPAGRPGPGGPADRIGPPREAGEAYRQETVLNAVAKAGFRDARVIDVKKRHAEVSATGADGRAYELHVEFDGDIRKREDVTLITDEGAVRSLVEKAGYAWGGGMRPEKKHVVVTATNTRGEKVELDVHRDGSIRKERRVF